MALEPGTTLLHYRLTEKIGEGGMGVVWKALDTTLDRDVAIKVLPEELADNPDRLSRFEREAKLLAALNHPNISAVFGLHRDQGVHFLAMEYVPGEDLAERLARGALPLEPALELALQIIDALEAAHDQGIVHRDLKPANVRITPEGQVKVLDLGLAKAFETETGRPDVSTSLSPTMTSTGTIAGMLLGTAAYMSPEQARGHVADRRSDVWAFGATLFEMLNGRRPFEGDTISDTLASILKLEPDWALIEAQRNPPLERLLRRCLAKNRSDRLHHIADARLEVQEALAYEPEEASGSTAVPVAPTPIWLRLLPWGLSLVLAIAALAFSQQSPPSGVTPPQLNLEVMMPPGILLASQQQGSLALSPDGAVLAFIGDDGTDYSLFIRRLDTPGAIRIPGTESANSPFFSPDSRWVAYYGADGKLRKIPVEGGIPITICEYPGTDRGGAWGDNGQIYLTPDFSSGLMQVAASGGTPRPLTTLDTEKLERTHRWPQAVRGHDVVIFTVGTDDSPENYDNSLIDAVRPSTGERVTLYEGASFARYLPSGHLLLARQGFLFAAPFDIETLEMRGEPMPVLEGVLGQRNSGVVQAGFSDGGLLAYVSGGQTERRHRLVWHKRDGSEEAIAVPERGYQEPVISPDGRRIAVAVEGSARFDIWIYDIAAETLSRLTFEGDNQSPVWSPDGTQVAFASIRSGEAAIYEKAIDGLSEAREVYREPGVTVYPTGYSPDGKLMLIEVANALTRMDVKVIPLDGQAEPRELVAGKAYEGNARFSPDGTWIVYESSESGRVELFVMELRAGGGRGQVTTDGGFDPLWATDGKIYYRTPDGISAAEIQTSPSLSIGRREVVAGNLGSGIDGKDHAVSADGERLLLVLASEDDESSLDRIRVISGWGTRMVQDLDQR